MYLVFDIGGTNTRIASSLDGKTLNDIKIVSTEKDFEQEIQLIGKLASELAGTEERGFSSKIEAAAGGVAGTLSPDKDTLLAAPHLSEWIQKPLKEELEANLDSPVYLENDAHLGGLGEATFGSGIGYRIVGYITVSTGVGGVKIVNQKIDENAQGFEVGHQIIQPDGQICDCGGKGHWETLIGGAYLERKYERKPEDIEDDRVWNEVTKNLSIGLHNVIVSWSPDIIVLGGSVMKSVSLEKVKSQVSEYLTIFPHTPKVVLATLEDKAGLYGALNYLKSR